MESSNDNSGSTKEIQESNINKMKESKSYKEKLKDRNKSPDIS